MNKHCWHEKGVTLACYPPQTPMVCCKCGASATKHLKMERIPGHGKFAPVATTLVEEPLPDGPCTGSIAD